jgi:hypothetical protein
MKYNISNPKDDNTYKIADISPCFDEYILSDIEFSLIRARRDRPEMGVLPAPKPFVEQVETLIELPVSVPPEKPDAERAALAKLESKPKIVQPKLKRVVQNRTEHSTSLSIPSIADEDEIGALGAALLAATLRKTVPHKLDRPDTTG